MVALKRLYAKGHLGKGIVASVGCQAYFAQSTQTTGSPASRFHLCLRSPTAVCCSPLQINLESWHPQPSCQLTVMLYTGLLANLTTATTRIKIPPQSQPVLSLCHMTGMDALVSANTLVTELCYLKTHPDRPIGKWVKTTRRLVLQHRQHQHTAWPEHCGCLSTAHHCSANC